MMHYLIIGEGMTAASVIRYCESQSIRTTQIADAGELVALREQNFDEVVISPGLSRAHPEVAKLLAKGLSVIGDIELFMRAYEGKVIAVTGSNGKSTTVSMIQHILKFAGMKSVLGGNIGVPALDLLSEASDIAVLELSSFQLESTPSMHSEIAVVLNVSEDHLDRYQGLEHYASVKQHIFQNAALCLCSVNDCLSQPPEKTALMLPSARVLAESMIWIDGETVAAIEGIKGINRLNASFALTVTTRIGLSPHVGCSALASFTPLDHRNQWVATLAGVDYVNDSKATNPGATLSTVQGSALPVYLILGGQTKGADLEPVAQAVAENGIGFVSIGVDAARFEAILPAAKFIRRANSLEEAVQVLHKIASPGTAVVLSPSAASLDMFSNYQARGDAFKAAVKALELQ